MISLITGKHLLSRALPVRPGERGGISADGYGQTPGLSQQTGQQGNEGHTDQRHTADSDKLLYALALY